MTPTEASDHAPKVLTTIPCATLIQLPGSESEPESHMRVASKKEARDRKSQAIAFYLAHREMVEFNTKGDGIYLPLAHEALRLADVTRKLEKRIANRVPITWRAQSNR